MMAYIQRKKLTLLWDIDLVIMRINLSILLCVTAILSACNNPNGNKKPTSNGVSGINDITIQQYSEEAVITQSPGKLTKDLPEGISYGRYENRECSGNADNNLIRQYSTYFKALESGDKNACLKYLFKDALTYHRKLFPSYSEQKILDIYFEGMSAATKLSDIAFDNGMDLYPAIPLFITKVTCGDEVFVAFKSAISLCSYKHYLKYNTLERCIAFSDNGGKKWSFITVNEDTREILSLRCSPNTINALLGE